MKTFTIKRLGDGKVIAEIEADSVDAHRPEHAPAAEVSFRVNRKVITQPATHWRAERSYTDYDRVAIIFIEGEFSVTS